MFEAMVAKSLKQGDVPVPFSLPPAFLSSAPLMYCREKKCPALSVLA